MSSAGSTDDQTKAAVARLRRQFEGGEQSLYRFGAGKIPEYSVLEIDKLPGGVQAKLAERRARGYPNPRAMTRTEASNWEQARSANTQSKNEAYATSRDKTLSQGERSNAGNRYLELRRELTKAEADRYGGPLHLPATPSTWAIGVGVVCGGLAILTLMMNEQSGRIGIAVLLFVLALAAVAFGVLNRRPPAYLTDADRDEIDRATTYIHLSPGEYKEFRLASYAAALVGQIAASPAWASKFLADHRIEFDYQAELRQITTHAYELHSILVELGSPPTGDSDQALRARDHFEQSTAPLEAVWLALIERVAALESFTLHLAELDAQLANNEAADRATRLEGRIGSLLVSAVSDELAAEHTRAVTDRSRYAAPAIEASLDALRGDIRGLTALAQSHAAQYEPS